MAIWEEKKDGLSNYVYPKPIKEFEEEFEKALKSPKEEIFDKLNFCFFAKSRSKSIGPSYPSNDRLNSFDVSIIYFLDLFYISLLI